MKNRFLSILLALCMVLTLVPISAFAEENSEVQTCICEAACAAEAMNTDCPICGVEGATAENCSKYEAPVEESEPEQTKVQALIDALPDADSITEENRADVEAQLATIDEAKFFLEDEWDALDFTKYNAAIASLNELDGMGGAEVPETLAVKPLQDLIDEASENGIVKLENDYQIPDSLTISKSVTLDLNGHVIKVVGSGSVIKITTGHLTLKDSNPTAAHSGDYAELPSGGVITGGFAEEGGGVYVGSEGKFTMKGGTITGCTASDHGGGVYVDGGGKFTMEGGTISGCTASQTGGGVHVDDGGEFTMEGGTISNCKRGHGGGVCNFGTFTMEGGTISGCTVTLANGGGVCNFGTFTMEGGSISNCRADRGGGVYNEMNGTLKNTSTTGGATICYGELVNDGSIEGKLVKFYNGDDLYAWEIVPENAKAVKPADPQKSGYALEGWYKETTFDNKWDFGNDTVSADMQLYAKWVCEHTGGTATCTEKAKCVVCGVEYGEVDNSNHSNLNHYTEKAATVNTLGNIEYRYCDGCDKYFTDADCKNEIESVEETYLYAVIFNTDGGTPVEGKYTVKWHDKVLDGVTAPTKDGYEFIDWKYGTAHVTESTEYKTLVANKSTASVELTAQWKDITAPTGEIKLGTNSWKAFLNNITFGLFFKDTQEVTITANDNSGEAVKIEYLLSDKELTAEELATATFTAYTDKFNVEPNNEYVIYAKLTDKTGNVTYINSNGIVLDNIAPVISGIVNGNTYCEAQTVTVNDKYEVTVTVNGTPVTLDANGQFTLSPASGTQTVVATDKVGNVSAEMIVTVNDGHETDTPATCIKKAVCKHCGVEYGEVDNSNHDLENIKESVATVTVTGNTEYWHCKDCDNNFSDKDGKNAIDLKDTVIGKLPPEIIDGKGQSLTEGEKRELSFRSNAAYSDFIRVEVDGKTVDEKNYTVKEGSTIVTLKADYVATLSVGEHTLGIVSQSGTATTTFTVNAKVVNDNTSPATGDNSHMALWFVLLFVSGGALVGTAIYGKKKKRFIK